MPEPTPAAPLTLFMFPGACSRVTMSALEEAGVPYEERMVNIMAGGQKSGDYLAVNPKGKVPALHVGDRTMTENAAILWYLHHTHPAARLLPTAGDAADDNQGLIDLIWCSGTLHPIVRQVRMPSRLTSGDITGVRADGTAKFAHECEVFTDRVSGGRWWYGDAWSIVDVYLYWLCGTAVKGGFPLADHPELLAHMDRVRARPSFQRAQAREAAMAERHRADLPADFQV